METFWEAVPFQASSLDTIFTSFSQSFSSFAGGGRVSGGRARHLPIRKMVDLSLSALSLLHLEVNTTRLWNFMSGV